MAVKKGPPKGSPRREYPSNVVRYAQRLYDENGYTVNEVREALRKRGHTPTRATVLCWVDPDFHTYWSERRYGGRGQHKTRTRTWRARLERMRRLRADAQLSAEATARVMALDFGVDLSRHQVNALLADEVQPKTAKKLLHPESA